MSTGQEFVMGEGHPHLYLPSLPTCVRLFIPVFHLGGLDSPYFLGQHDPRFLGEGLPPSCSLQALHDFVSTPTPSPGHHSILNISFKLVKGKVSFACVVSVQFNFPPTLIKRESSS